MNQSCVERKGNREVRVSIGNRNLVVKEVNFLRSTESTAFHSSLGLGSVLNTIFFPQLSWEKCLPICYKKEDSILFPEAVGTVGSGKAQSRIPGSNLELYGMSFVQTFPNQLACSDINPCSPTSDRGHPQKVV